jgi:hypothetical protein
MTIINRVCPGLIDIKSVQLECANEKCHAVVSYTLDLWAPRALDCPNCGVTLIRHKGNDGNESRELFALKELAESLKMLLNLAETPKFQLRLAGC